MRFGILGPFEVADDDGRGVALGGHRQRALLAILLLHAGEVVSSDRLIEELWGGRPPATAVKTVQVYVSKLRKALGDRVLVTRSGGYMLDIKPVDVDVGRFQALVGEAHGALQRRDPRGAAESLRAGLALWRGPPLSDFAYEPFAQGEIARLDEARLVALEDRVDAELELGEHASLVGELEALVLTHPLRERMHGQLMLALYRAGRQADALEAYQRARTYLADELGLEPGPALRDLQSQILDQAPGLGAATQQHSPVARLPRPATPTIGREREVQEISGLLRTPGERLVTLTGTGGVGKTRLALVLAHALQGSFIDGAVWVELAGLARAEDVAPTIARALEVTPAPGESSQQALCRELANKPLLLVLDNFEHVLDAAEAIGELLRAGDGLTILVTSREALNLSAEHRVLVAPLSLPEDREHTSVADIGSASATALFLDAARRRQAALIVTPASAPVIAQVCARLDGLPLALELAAARAELLGIQELAARLASLADLGTGPRDSPARQRTLSATIDWSYQLLDQQQRTAFARFAVFASGATLDAAEAVTGAPLATLEALLVKNLLTRRAAADGSTRLVMLVTIRSYALERLAEDPDRDGVYRRHLETNLQLVERCAPQLSTHTEPEALMTIEREIDNTRAALDWALDHAPCEALRLIGLLGECFWIRGNSDALPSLDAAIRAAGEQAPPQDRARAYLARAYQLRLRVQIKAAHTAAMVALGLYESVDDEGGMSEACYGIAFLSGGHPGAERRFAERACEHARRAGDEALLGSALARRVRSRPAAERPAALQELTTLLTRSGNYRQLMIAYNNCGDMAIKEGRIDEALDLLGVAESAIAQRPSPWHHMRLVNTIALAHLFGGNHPRARATFARELTLRDSYGFDSSGAFCLAGLAALAALDDQLERAALLLGAARAEGYAEPDDRVLEHRIEQDYLGPARAVYGEAAWTRAEQAGRALPREQALVHARETAGLTSRNADLATPSDGPSDPQHKARTDRTAPATKRHPRPGTDHERPPPPLSA
jgi:predicted ATPase/DNA-binding SARP family transcriptional activator